MTIELIKYERIGDYLKEKHLIPNNWSIAHIARLMGVPRTTLSRIIRKNNGISADMAIRLSIVLGGDPLEWLMLNAQCRINAARNKNFLEYNKLKEC